MPKRIYRVLLLAIVVLTVGASGVQAAPFTPELEADYQAALAWWGVPAPSQCASVAREILLTGDPEGEGVAERATQPEPGETGVECRIRLFEPALAQQFPSACEKEATIRHAVGHLLGYGHSTDPASIMNPARLNSACPDPVEELRWRRLTVQSRCIELPPAGKRSKRCWAKSRRLLHEVLAAVNAGSN